MTVWAFILLLCCPFGEEHSIEFSAPTKTACDRMRIVVNREVNGFGLKAKIEPKCIERPKDKVRE